MIDYRTRLRRRGLEPVTIQRTEKREGDLVLVSSSLPVVRVTQEGGVK